MTPPLDCSTVIVSYNTFDLTRTAVATALEAAGALAHEVIVVDNASPDGSAARLADAFAGDARVRVVAQDGNAGFSAANNVGARLARGRVLYFLNPDTVSRPGSVEALVRFVDAHPEAGAVGPRVLNADGTDQPSVTGFDTLGSLLRYHFPVRPGPPLPARTSPVDIVIGCALALSRAAFDRVGGWDERYFMYAEEFELCWQLRDAGYTSYYVREAEIMHLGGQAGLDRYTEQQLINARSGVAFMRRHYPAYVLWTNRAAGTVAFAVRTAAFAALARLKPAQAAAYRRRGGAARALWAWYALTYR